MQFEPIMRKSHITDQVTITGFRLSLFISEQEVVFTVYLEYILWQLCAELAAIFCGQLIRRSSLGAGIGKEGDSEAPFR